MVVVSNGSVIAEHRRDPRSPAAPEHPGNGAGSQVLAIEDLHVKVEDHEILRGVDLVVKKGELHALMGPNGSGKSPLANTIAGTQAASKPEMTASVVWRKLSCT
jgi:ABC-type molybdenum transport system ATPase subunit/photorepair protein PhrA